MHNCFSIMISSRSSICFIYITRTCGDDSTSIFANLQSAWTFVVILHPLTTFVLSFHRKLILGHHCESFVQIQVPSYFRTPTLFQLASDIPIIVHTWTLLHWFDYWICRCGICIKSSRTVGILLFQRDASTIIIAGDCGNFWDTDWSECFRGDEARWWWWWWSLDTQRGQWLWEEN